MDKQLQDIISPDGNAAKATIDFIDDAAAKIDILHGEQRETYQLKPLGELYGAGPGGSVDPKNDAYMPLFLGIEEEIAKFDATQRRLTDADAALALNALGMSPEAPSPDPLVQRLQCALRLNLSLNEYSRSQLRQVIRRISRSVERHTESGGGRGYLNFIQGFFGRISK